VLVLVKTPISSLPPTLIKQSSYRDSRAGTQEHLPTSLSFSEEFLQCRTAILEVSSFIPKSEFGIFSNLQNSESSCSTFTQYVISSRKLVLSKNFFQMIKIVSPCILALRRLPGIPHYFQYLVNVHSQPAEKAILSYPCMAPTIPPIHPHSRSNCSRATSQ